MERRKRRIDKTDDVNNYSANFYHEVIFLDQKRTGYQLLGGL